MLGNKGTGREYRDGGCRGGADQFKWEDVKGRLLLRTIAAQHDINIV